METGRIIGNNLKKYRDSHGLSQDQIASILGVDRSTISLYESGKREIPLAQLEKFTDLFAIELEDILEENAEKRNVNFAFAFRADSILEEDLCSIAEFQRIVKNYLKLKELTNEK